MRERIYYTIGLLCPMVFYYGALAIFPEWLAAARLFGWPLSLLLGVLVMLWGVAVALHFAYRQSMGEVDDREEGGAEKYE